MGSFERSTEIRSSDNAVLKREGGFATQDAAKTAGRRLAQSTPSTSTVHYYFADHLGSTRVVTDSGGSACYKADFLPYGTENTPSGFSNTCSTSYKFTGYERDPETAYGNSSGNDYAFARYYNSRLGRFMSGDPLAGDISDPQTMNRYTYARNNPINLTDPSGMLLGNPMDPSNPDPPDPCQFASIWDPWDFFSCGSGYGGGSCETEWTCANGAFDGFFNAQPPLPPLPPYAQALNLANKVLSGKNDCANFFNSSVFSTPPIVDPMSATQALASDKIKFIYSLPPSEPGEVDDAGLGPGSTIHLNGFENGSFLPLPTSNLSTKVQVFGGVFVGGTLAGQTATILHELAHTLGLIPDDSGGNRDQSLANNGIISRICAGAIFSTIAVGN